MVYGAREIRLIAKFLFNWSIVISKGTLFLFLFWTQNIFHSIFSIDFPLLSKMSQSSRKSKATMLEDKSEKKDKALESKKVETKVNTHIGPSVETSVTRKKSVTKIKSLKKIHVQTHDSDSNADED